MAKKGLSKRSLTSQAKLKRAINYLAKKYGHKDSNSKGILATAAPAWTAGGVSISDIANQAVSSVGNVLGDIGNQYTSMYNDAVSLLTRLTGGGGGGGGASSSASSARVPSAGPPTSGARKGLANYRAARYAPYKKHSEPVFYGDQDPKTMTLCNISMPSQYVAYSNDSFWGSSKMQDITSFQKNSATTFPGYEASRRLYLLQPYEMKTFMPLPSVGLGRGRNLAVELLRVDYQLGWVPPGAVAHIFINSKPLTQAQVTAMQTTSSLNPIQTAVDFQTFMGYLRQDTVAYFTIRGEDNVLNEITQAPGTVTAAQARLFQPCFTGQYPLNNGDGKGIMFGGEALYLNIFYDFFYGGAYLSSSATATWGQNGYCAFNIQNPSFFADFKMVYKLKVVDEKFFTAITQSRGGAALQGPPGMSAADDAIVADPGSGQEVALPTRMDAMDDPERVFFALGTQGIYQGQNPDF